MFNKYKGVPNSHREIIYTCLGFLVLALVLGLITLFQFAVDYSFLNFNIHIINSDTWSWFSFLFIGFTLFIVIDDIVFFELGYWKKYQYPLHKTVRSFYKKSNAPFAEDNTGRLYRLSNSELGDRNKAVRHMFLKKYENGLLLVIPCSRWGLVGVAENIINNLRDNQGSLDFAQSVISHNFPKYRCSIRHYHFKSHYIYWYLMNR